MSTSVHKIARALLIPLTIDTFLVLVLLLLALFPGGSALERVVLVIIFIPLLYILLESISRKVTIRDNGIKIKKLLRKKDLNWEDITSVGAVIAKKKIYLVLTTTKGFHALSNSYENFFTLVQKIVDNVGKEKVEEDVLDLIEHPTKKIPNLISTWVAAIVLLGAVYAKLTHF
ncbi:MAG: hypothetical protein IMF11_19495 [Proteobacteria bacterium]|nr:hypothetical protein [Pseudomonadota bacterium]